eukprot:1161638-Pelagomonas_calceolata.AAC.6
MHPRLCKGLIYIDRDIAGKGVKGVYLACRKRTQLRLCVGFVDVGKENAVKGLHCSTTLTKGTQYWLCTSCSLLSFLRNDTSCNAAFNCKGMHTGSVSFAHPSAPK